MFWPLTSIPIIWGVGNDVKLIWYPKLRPLCMEVKVQTFPMQFSSVLDHTSRLVMFLSRVSVMNHSEGISCNFLGNPDKSKAPIWPLSQDEVMIFKFSQSEIYTAYIFCRENLSNQSRIRNRPINTRTMGVWFHEFLKKFRFGTFLVQIDHYVVHSGWYDSNLVQWSTFVTFSSHL